MSGPPETGGQRGGSVRWRLRVAYDGSGYRGFAVQEGQVTVAGALAGALSRYARSPVTLTCAGRTDAGVHALDQVVHFDLPAESSAAHVPAAHVKTVNRQVGPAIVVRVAEIAPDGFDARRSATGRRYRYLVVNAPVADPLLAGLTWQVAEPLDLRAMEAASDALLGEHDFRAFCRRVPGTSPDDPMPRRVRDARWTLLDDDLPRSRTEGTAGRRTPAGSGAVERGPGLLPAVGDLLAFEIEANAFCHQMVRSLVGSLVDVGRGRKRPSGHPRDPPLRRPPAGGPARPAPRPLPGGGPVRG